MWIPARVMMTQSWLKTILFGHAEHHLKTPEKLHL
jgi:hypothetical protein